MPQNQLQVDYMKQEIFLGLDRRGQNQDASLAPLAESTGFMYYLTAEGVRIRIRVDEVDASGDPVV